jgi:hypothetical protein
MPWWKVQKHKPIIFFPLLLVLAGVSVWAHLVGPESPGTAHKFSQPFEVVHDFMESVKRGELKAFDITLTPEMINPERVDYSFQLESSSYCIIIYSSLVKPISSPQLEGVMIHGISAVVDKDGTIIETRVHVQAVEQTEE